ncbi:MAG TPA: hypothetical protein VJZ27_11585, partial [Aggregatilineales bacterium]|nr:hypothetical protein [Aggregatilineales bacterium]
MNLSDYQWSRNPRGMHGSGTDHSLWDQWNLGWMKTVYEDNGGLQWAAYALEKGITPITRIFRREMSGKPFDDSLRAQYQEHLNYGVKWFEFYNEPNLPFEWYPGVELHHNNPNLIRDICENWLPWAEFIINNGAYPAFIPLSETSEDWGETTAWIKKLLKYM